MILHLTWLWNDPKNGPLRTVQIPVDYAHPIPGWLVYRITGNQGEHWTPSTSIRDVWAEPEAGDPDPMSPSG